MSKEVRVLDEISAAESRFFAGHCQANVWMVTSLCLCVLIVLNTKIEPLIAN